MSRISREETDRQGFQARARAAARGLLFCEHISIPWPRRTRDVCFAEVPKQQAGITELFAHPVCDGDELRAYDATYAHIRAHDAECLTDPSVAERLERHAVRRISFRQLRDLQRAIVSRG
jgi:hypothetical protein